jgi:hypothetical protein
MTAAARDAATPRPPATRPGAVTVRSGFKVVHFVGQDARHWKNILSPQTPSAPGTRWREFGAKECSGKVAHFLADILAYFLTATDSSDGTAPPPIPAPASAPAPIPDPRRPAR